MSNMSNFAKNIFEVSGSSEELKKFCDFISTGRTTLSFKKIISTESTNNLIGVVSQESNAVQISFLSEWSTPISDLAVLFNRFPELSFVGVWANEYIGLNAGVWSRIKDVPFAIQYFEDCTANTKAFANAIWQEHLDAFETSSFFKKHANEIERCQTESQENRIRGLTKKHWSI